MEPHTGFNNLDFIVLGIVFLSGVLAMFRGFVHEVLSLVSWVLAYFIAAKYYHLLEPWVHHHIKNETGASLAAGTGLFLIVLLVCALLSNVIVGLVRGKALNTIDRSLGFAFGLIRGALVISIVYLALTAIFWPDLDKAVDKEAKDEGRKPPEWIIEAKTRPAMARGAEFLRKFIPEKDLKAVKSEYSEQKDKAEKLINDQKLEILSTPVPAVKDAPTPTYDNTNRSDLDQLINQKSKP